MEVATAAAMRNIDKRTIDTYRVPGIVLMENAGLELLRFLQAQWPNLSQRRVTIIAGPGNNGGDGFILARHLWHRRTPVRVAMLTPVRQLRGDARRAYHMAQAYGVPLVSCTTAAAWRRFAGELRHTDLIVDALLGTGLRRPASGLYAEVIETVNEAEQPVVAVDIPSGLSADHGHLLGPHIQATHTVTFALPKCGLLLYPAAAAVGTLSTVDIGIPQAAVDAEEIDVTLLQASDMSRVLPVRHADAHKGSHGHLLVVAGSAGKSGAGVLSSQAALRGGAGLVTFALPRSLNAAMESQITEVMTLPVAENGEGALTSAALPDLTEFLSKASALVLGPGLGTHTETVTCVHALLQRTTVPVVLDADGLNCVADYPDVLKTCQAPVIMTPHPGELSRLLGVSTTAVQSQRLDIAYDFARDYGVYVVLKGAGTVIYAPDGRRSINPTGNAAMATAGTGDVLAGLIGALLCQNMTPLQAAQCGVYLHGLAGDRVRDRLGGSGLIASDLIGEIPYAAQALRQVAA
ncbi:MAG: NAD(P)H-hydrate dehydratase [Candidatus Tectomicrobia bacterium]|nr:NAD(P)H-hydrate dehydratase [Candidatus Tectomicrobia bacterium]